MDNDTTPAPPPGYHLATGEELKCLPEGSMWLYDISGEWVCSIRDGKNTIGTSLRYVCPDAVILPLTDKDATPTPPPGYHLATDEELRCLPDESKYYSVGEWIYSEECGTNVIGTFLRYVCPDAQPAPPPLDPKGDAGKLKPQLQLIPSVFNIEVAAALQSGANKYGPWNWRSNRVEMMTYIGAMRRHLDALLDGEDRAPDSGVHHLGHVAASCAIVLDAARHGTLVDNRPATINTEAP